MQALKNTKTFYNIRCKILYYIDLTIVLQIQHFILTLPRRRRIIKVEMNYQQVIRKRVFFLKTPENKET